MKNSKSIIILYIAVSISAASLFAQKKTYKVNRENAFSNFYLLNVSKDNNWLYYNSSIHLDENRASVKKRNAEKVFDFKNGHTGKFSNNSKWFSILSNNNTLNWISLKTYRKDSLQEVITSRFTTNANFLIAQTVDNDIYFVDLNTGEQTTPGQSSLYSIRPVQDGVAVVLNSGNGNVLKIVDLKNNSGQEVLNLPKGQIKRVAWNKKGDKIAFVFKKGHEKPWNLGVFDCNSKAIRFLKGQTSSAKNKTIPVEDAEISMNNAGNRVFFYVKNKNHKTNTNPDIEVWDTSDPVILSRKKTNYEDRVTSLLNVWLPDSGSVIPIETKEQSKAFWSPNTEYAISYSPVQYEPQFNFQPFADLYALDLGNGKKQKIIEKQYTHGNYLKQSPRSNYIAYFKDNHWWVYNIKLNQHTNITEGIPVRFDNESLTSYSFPEPFGLSAWSSDEKEVYINDAYDIWKISVDGKQQQKLTDGRKNKIRYRIVDVPGIQKIESNEYAMRIPVLQAENEIFLSAQNRQNYSSGFSILKPNGSIDKIAFKDKKLSKLHPLNNNRFIFQEESLNIPPSVTYVNTKTKKENTIVKSNKGWEDFKWPEKKLIQYTTDFAENLNGILIFPVNYNPNKKYPMVVHVYENFSIFFHTFKPPTINEVGFNYMNYSLEDYFVLLPDIVYQKNKVGSSATQCVMSAIDKVLEVEKSVDEKKLGLIGHSFGGYETAFIITQTDRFKAAVVGSGVFNLYSKYFEIQKLMGRPEYIRVEKGQYRMKDGFFENKKAYLKNSPIHHFDKVKTPLFIWSGKEDPNVNPNQSIQGFLALRRLQKPAKMYLYENEGHVILDKNNQVHLTNQIKNWFDFYFK